MAAGRRALVIATYDYADGGLTAAARPGPRRGVVRRRPGGPGHRRLRRHHRWSTSRTTSSARRSPTSTASARRDDLTLLYFTGHGLKDDEGRLYLAMTNTRRDGADVHRDLGGPAQRRDGRLASRRQGADPRLLLQRRVPRRPDREGRRGRADAGALPGQGTGRAHRLRRHPVRVRGRRPARHGDLVGVHAAPRGGDQQRCRGPRRGRRHRPRRAVQLRVRAGGRRDAAAAAEEAGGRRRPDPHRAQRALDAARLTSGTRSRAPSRRSASPRCRNWNTCTWWATPSSAPRSPSRSTVLAADDSRSVSAGATDLLARLGSATGPPAPVAVPAPRPEPVPPPAPAPPVHRPS